MHTSMAKDFVLNLVGIDPAHLPQPLSYRFYQLLMIIFYKIAFLQMPVEWKQNIYDTLSAILLK